MSTTILHIWRNSPMGRENLLQSIYLAQQIDARLAVYRPMSTQGLMYFEHEVVTVDLDKSYLAEPETAIDRLEALLTESKLPWSLVEPEGYTASSLPKLPSQWSLMACPRALSDCTSRIGLGHIGSRVRTIVRHADFPVFIPSTCYKPWNRIAAFFGGSQLGLRATRLAMRLAERAEVPLTVYTQLDPSGPEKCRAMLQEAGFFAKGKNASHYWEAFGSGSLEANLYEVPSDSLVVVGAAGENLMRELLFGSKLELIQTTLPNPLMVVGPNGRITL